jgi:hypothetical protein
MRFVPSGPYNTALEYSLCCLELPGFLEHHIIIVLPRLHSHIATANTCIARTIIIDWNSIDHINRGILCSVIPGARMFMIVVIMLIPPSIVDTPER